MALPSKYGECPDCGEPLSPLGLCDDCDDPNREEPPKPAKPVDPLQEMRKRRLGLLLADMTVKTLSELSGYKVSTIGFMRSPSGKISDQAARQFEEVCERPVGWLDGGAKPQTPAAPEVKQDRARPETETKTEPDLPPPPVAEPAEHEQQAESESTKPGKFAVEYGIEKPRRIEAGTLSPYPFDTMGVGGSFHVRLADAIRPFAPGTTERQQLSRLQRRLQMSWQTYRKSSGRRELAFSARVMENADGEIGIRVFRDPDREVSS